MMGRTVNKARRDSMLLWLDVARAEMPCPIDPDELAEFESELKDEIQLNPDYDPAKVPVERQMKVMTAAMRCLPKFAKIDAGRLVVQEDMKGAWINAVADALGDDDLYADDESALKAFLNRLELRILPTGKTRDRTMQEYSAAAALFNSQLSRDQEKGKRLSERPVTASAIRSADARKNSAQ
jgi:hypothetical protein